MQIIYGQAHYFLPQHHHILLQLTSFSSHYGTWSWLIHHFIIHWCMSCDHVPLWESELVSCNKRWYIVVKNIVLCSIMKWIISYDYIPQCELKLVNCNKMWYIVKNVFIHKLFVICTVSLISNVLTISETTSIADSHFSNIYPSSENKCTKIRSNMYALGKIKDSFIYRK